MGVQDNEEKKCSKCLKHLPLEAYDRQSNGIYRRTCRECLEITKQETQDRIAALKKFGHFWDCAAIEEENFIQVAEAEEEKGGTAYIRWLKAIINARSHPKKQSVASIRYAHAVGDAGGAKLRLLPGRAASFVRA